jgi:hypothetical protein
MVVSTVSSDLLNKVLNTARDAGSDQITLARVAGVAPETISRAKKRKTMDVATLNALAMAAGLKLTLTPHGGDERGGAEFTEQTDPHTRLVGARVPGSAADRATASKQYGATRTR